MRYLAATLTILVVMTGVLNHDLWNPHEHRDGAVALEMARSGDFVVPTLGGQPFLEKPPLSYATGALLVRWLGTEPARTIRAASALYALGTIAAVFAIGRILFGSDVAQFACGLLATTLGFYVLAHFIVTDAGLTFFVALALLGFVQFAFARQQHGRVVLFAGAAGGFLCKGVIGCAFPALAVVTFALASREPKLILRCVSPLGLLLLAGAIAAWLVPLYRRDGGEHFHEWLGQNVERFLGKQAFRLHHEQNPAYYLYAFPYVCLPWSLTWPRAVWQWLRGARARPSRESMLLLAWGLSGLLLLSLSLTKRDLYAYPVIAPFSLLVARDLMARGASRLMRGWVIVLALLAMIGPPLLLAAGVSGITTRPGALTTIAWGLPLLATALVVARAAMGGGSPWMIIAAPALLVTLGNVLLVPARDAVVSFRSPVERLAAHLRQLPNVVSWKLGETMTGALSFYADLRLQDFDRPKRLERHLRTTPGAFLLVDDERLADLALDVVLKRVDGQQIAEYQLGIYRPRKGKRSGAAR